MSIGKKKCRILKEIRAEIAKNNDISYTIEDCKYQGDCSGTCPKCEAEVAALEAELAKRQAAGKKILLTGVAASMVVSMASCTPPTPLGGEIVTPESETVLSQPADSDGQTGNESATEGEISLPASSGEGYETMGEPPLPEDPENESDPDAEPGSESPANVSGDNWELMGDYEAE